MSFATKDTPLSEKQINNKLINNIKEMNPKENDIATFLKSKQFNYTKKYSAHELDVLNKKYNITNVEEKDLFDDVEFFEEFYSEVIKDTMKCYYTSKGHQQILDELEIFENDEATNLTVKNTLYIFTPEEMKNLFQLMTVKK